MRLLAVSPLTGLINLPVPNHGILHLSPPLGWKETSRETPIGKSPFLALERSGKVRGSLELSVRWSPSSDASFFTETNIRELVIRGQRSIRENAIEQDLPLTPIRGTNGNGFYYSVTDKTYKSIPGKPTPGEYPILTHGELGVGKLVLSFSILSDVKGDEAVQEGLAIVRGMTLTNR
jgi:hypothetical protein